MQKLIITVKDRENERLLFEEEKIFPVTDRNMFRGGLYCILSAAERWQKLKTLHQELLAKNLDTPIEIVENKSKLREILEEARFPQRKFDRVYGFAKWWQDSDLPNRIRYDIKKGRKNEFPLRYKIVEEAPGMGCKCASYFLNLLGYENVVAVDLWMLRFLNEQGFSYNGKPIKVPDFETNGGPQGREFLTYERMVQNMSSKYNVSPSKFQRILWTKYSNWKS